MMLYIKEGCPACRHMAGVPLLFGMPGPPAFEAEQRGELVLGGCIPMYDQGGNRFNLACLRCAHHWYDPNFEDEEEDFEEE
jgi:hypothetical protein